MKSSSKSSPVLPEQQWVDIIIRSFTKDMDINPCVLRIPERLRDTKPEAYTPQQIGLGPYHHFRPQFFEMETRKCFAVRKFLKQEQSLAFKDLVVDRMRVLEPIIRASYDKYMDFDGNTLAWIMAVDGLYLLQFLSTWVRHDQLDDAVGDGDLQRLAMDIMMLENQIPVVVLQEICKSLQLQSNDPTNNWLLNDFYLFCKEKSPLKLIEESKFRYGSRQVHLLDYMYQLIVNNQVKKELISPVATIPKHRTKTTSSETPAPSRKTGGAFVNSTTGILKIAANSFAAVQIVADTAAVLGIKGAADVQNHLKLLQSLKHMLPSSKESQKPNESDQTTSSIDEIDIPTVSELCKVSKIRFKLTPGGIRDVEFDDMEKIFYLPVITLGSNSEVVIRNLVAYEAALAKPGSSLELAEYIDLMCGIIDTANDACLLRKEGIIEGTLTDERIAQMFNGIKKSTSNLDEKSNIGMVVKKVNNQWGNGWHKKKHPQPARSSL